MDNENRKVQDYHAPQGNQADRMQLRCHLEFGQGVVLRRLPRWRVVWITISLTQLGMTA
jgi:hypothetical protein